MAKPQSKQTEDVPVFKITMVGTFFAQVGQTRDRQPYEVDFLMSERELNLLDPEPFFKHHVAGIVMPRKYPSFYQANDGSQLETFRVAGASCENHPSALREEIRLLTRSGLIRYIEDKGFPIETQIYDDDQALRQAIRDYKKDPDGFKKNQTMFLKRKKLILDVRKQYASVCSQEELLEMNGIAAPKHSQSDRESTTKKKAAAAAAPKPKRSFEDLDI